MAFKNIHTAFVTVKYCKCLVINVQVVICLKGIITNSDTCVIRFIYHPKMNNRTLLQPYGALLEFISMLAKHCCKELQSPFIFLNPGLIASVSKFVNDSVTVQSIEFIALDD